MTGKLYYSEREALARAKAGQDLPAADAVEIIERLGRLRVRKMPPLRPERSRGWRARMLSVARARQRAIKSAAQRSER